MVIRWATNRDDSFLYSSLEATTVSVDWNSGGAEMSNRRIDAVTKSKKVPPLKPPRTSINTVAKTSRTPPPKPPRTSKIATTTAIADVTTDKFDKVPSPKLLQSSKFYTQPEFEKYLKSSGSRPSSLRTPRGRKIYGIKSVRLSAVLENDEQENLELDEISTPSSNTGNLGQLPSSSSADEKRSQFVASYSSFDDIDLICGQVKNVPPSWLTRSIEKFKKRAKSTAPQGVEFTVAPELVSTELLEPIRQLDYNVTFHWMIPTSEVRH